MPENYPNFLTINPDGTISGVFPGGIQMSAAAPGDDFASRRITWIREADGALVATMAAFTGPDGGGSLDQVQITAGGDTANQSQIISQATRPGGFDGIGFLAESDNAGHGGAGVPAAMVLGTDINNSGEGPDALTIMDAGGRSSFLRMSAQSVFGAPTLAAFICFGPSVLTPALGAGAVGSSASFDTGMPTAGRDGLSLNFVRAFGDYQQAVSQLTHGFTVNTAGATVVVQASHRNVSAAAAAATAFGQIVIVVYS